MAIEKIHKVLSRALTDPRFRTMLIKNPTATVRSAGISMTKIELKQMTSFLGQHDLGDIKSEAQLRQMLEEFVSASLHPPDA
ncbi:MAG: Os1348 family NHLP clan protein [Promethearchaeota archaeon]